MPAAQALPKDHPLMVAWNDYNASDDFKNSRKWAQLVVITNEDNTESGDRSVWEGLTVKHPALDGSMWAAFMAGFAAAGGKITVD